MKNIIILKIIITLLVISSCKRTDTTAPIITEQDNIIKKWDSIPSKFKEVNAAYIAYISAEGKVYDYAQGINTKGGKVDENTIFEAASISKTYFAYLFWKMLLNKQITAENIQLSKCSGNDKISASPYEFLSHKIHPDTDSCIDEDSLKGIFNYSENAYLALQKVVENKLGKNLEELAKEEIFSPLNLEESSFIWNPNYDNYVDGYYQNNDLHRKIHNFTKPLANGTLYTSGKELITFCKNLIKSKELDSMQIGIAPVPGFSNLVWGRGIGTESVNNKKYVWQWGSNWSYTNFLLINTNDKTAIIYLSNSQVSQIRIRETVNWLLDAHLQSFDSIEW